MIGGSAGSIAALKTVFRELPRDLPASIFVVVHVSSESPGMLGHLLSQVGNLPAKNATDKEETHYGQIYVAPPDHHLILERGRVRVLRGPRENRHRPAIDPLFRSAARAYGPRVIGVLLSGLLDDGSAGLYAIKQRGGIAAVQDPKSALWSQMPQNALQYAAPQHIWRTEEIARNLTELAYSDEGTSMSKQKKSKMKGGKRSEAAKEKHTSADISASDQNAEVAYADEGEGTPSVFACPECHGVLWELRDDEMVRFRCRIGHSYGPDSLAKELSMASENALWAAVRALEEKAAMQRRIAEGIAGNGQTTTRLLEQSAADAANARLIREMIFGDTELDQDALRKKAS